MFNRDLMLTVHLAEPAVQGTWTLLVAPQATMAFPVIQQKL